jgi:hypothetical protein
MSPLLQNDRLFCSIEYDKCPATRAHSVNGRRQNAPISQHENASQIPPPPQFCRPTKFFANLANLAPLAVQIIEPVSRRRTIPLSN